MKADLILKMKLYKIVDSPEAKEAIADVVSSKEVATKADLAEVKADIKDMRHYIDAAIAKQVRGDCNINCVSSN